MKIERMKVINKGSIKAFFDLDLNKVLLTKFKLVQIDGKDPFISGPDESYTDKNGDKKYKKLVKIVDKDLEAKATSLAVAEYRKLNVEKTPEPVQDYDDLPW